MDCAADVGLCVGNPLFPRPASVVVGADAPFAPFRTEGTVAGRSHFVRPSGEGGAVQLDEDDCQTISLEVNEVTIGVYRTSGDEETKTRNMTINVTEYTNSRVAYQKTNKAAFDRYVDLLDTLK